MFVNQVVKTPVAHTDNLRMCGHCNGFGRIRCDDCAGQGFINCGKCGSSGRVNGECLDCRGIGKRTDTTEGRVREMACFTCAGSGELTNVTCPRCNGGGRVTNGDT